jgi:hypothetical protein
LRRAHQHVDAGVLHVDPDRARGNAVEHEQPADGMHRIGHRTQIGGGQDHAGRGFHMRCEHHVGPRRGDGGDDFVDRCRRKRALLAGRDAARLQHLRLRRNAAHFEDLRPAVAEPAVADDQDPLVGGELACHRFHAEGATARHDDGRSGVVDRLEGARDVAHHALEALGHVVERAVGVDDRVFKQPVGVDVGQEAGHVCLLVAARQRV